MSNEFFLSVIKKMVDIYADNLKDILTDKFDVYCLSNESSVIVIKSKKRTTELRTRIFKDYALKDASDFVFAFFYYYGSNIIEGQRLVDDILYSNNWCDKELK